MRCELCGKETKLVDAMIEGSEVKACPNCASFGKVLKKPKRREAFTTQKKEKVQVIKEGFGNLIKKSREDKGLSQEELAVKIGEKESQVKKLENEYQEPSISIAKRLEKELEVKLIEELQEDTDSFKSKKPSGPMTLGDLIKKK